MAITNGYATLADVKSRLRLTSTTDDTLLSELIEGASRAVDDRCGRRFYLATETRYYSARPDQGYLAVVNPFSERRSWSRYPLDVHDLISVSSLTTDEDGDRSYETTWSSSLDYYLEPVNAPADQIPYNRIRPDQVNGRFWFPPWPLGIKVVGSWGYAFDYGSGVAAPEPVREATTLLAVRLYKRKDAPFGVVEAGAIERMAIRLKGDEDITDLLAPYMYSASPRSRTWVVT